MGKIKSSIIDEVELLYLSNISNDEIMRRTGITEESTLDDILNYIDENMFDEDLVTNYPYSYD